MVVHKKFLLCHLWCSKWHYHIPADISISEDAYEWSNCIAIYWAIQIAPEDHWEKLILKICWHHSVICCMCNCVFWDFTKTDNGLYLWCVASLFWNWNCRYHRFYVYESDDSPNAHSLPYSEFFGSWKREHVAVVFWLAVPPPHSFALITRHKGLQLFPSNVSSVRNPTSWSPERWAEILSERKPSTVWYCSEEWFSTFLLLKATPLCA